LAYTIAVGKLLQGPISGASHAQGPALDTTALQEELNSLAINILTIFDTMWASTPEKHSGAFEDAGRDQHGAAFSRWQRDVLSRHKRNPLRNTSVPVSATGKVNAVSAEAETSLLKLLSNSDAYARIRRWAVSLGEHYLQDAAQLSVSEEAPLQAMVWCEALRHADMVGPEAHFGSVAAGLVWSRQQQSVRRWVFQDPRGINAPFGRRYEVNADEGVAAVFPSFLSYYVEPGGPNEGHDTMAEVALLWRFAVWPPVPESEWSWVDDPLAQVVLRQSSKVQQVGHASSEALAVPAAAAKAAEAASEAGL